MDDDGIPRPPRLAPAPDDLPNDLNARQLEGRSAEVGDPPITRLERDMGLDIDPDTGRAFRSQGDASNLGLGVGGRFHDAVMVPRSFHCSSCGHIEHEREWGHGFERCGALGLNPGTYRFEKCGAVDLGPGGRFNLCAGCIEKVLAALPHLMGQVAAMNGGRIRSRG